MIFLDRDLLIRIYTPAVGAIFSLIPSDRGRALTDIAHNLDHRTLAAEIRQVMADGRPHEARVSNRDGSTHYLMRILPYHGGNGKMDGALLVFVDITAPMQTEKQLRLLVHELNHRARNLLTVVSALARQTAGRSETVEEFVASFIGRVNALARSHGLLAKGRWSDIPLQELVAGEMEPHRRDMRGHIDQSGPPVLLKPKAAVAIGMILHELSVNAVKYGALGVADGRVSITWALDGADAGAHLILHWQEAGGPPVTTPTSAGFGTMLIERQAARELAGTATVEYPRGGVRATLAIPDDPELFLRPPAPGP